MKDTQARDDIKGLRREVFGSQVKVYGTVSLVDCVNALYRRVEALEAHSDLVEKPCPKCGHVTLMNQKRMDVFEGTIMREPQAPVLYCYGCGGEFVEEECKKLVPVQRANENSR